MLPELFQEDCFMLDIETTGLSPITNGMTSFCLVRFNLHARNLRSSILDYSHHRINSAVNVDMLRVNDMETVKFRHEAGIGYMEQHLNCLDSLQSIPETINEYIKQTNINHRHIFALHTEFDIAFLRGYFEATGHEFPFKHRNIWEIASMIKGMNQDLKSIRDEIADVSLMEDYADESPIPNLKPHNALYDCIRQIAFLRLSLMKAGIM